MTASISVAVIVVAASVADSPATTTLVLLDALVGVIVKVLILKTKPRGSCRFPQR